MRNFHISVWLGSAPKPRARTFIVLFTLVLAVRTALITVVPLRALAFLESAQAVSVLYLCVSFAGVASSLSIPWLVHRIKRRRVFSLAALAAVSAASCFISPHFPLFVLGMILQVFSIASFEISLNLYVMDHVPRQKLGKFEPLRIFFGAGVFAIGPWLGVFLSDKVGEWAPFLLSAVAATLVLIIFWYLRLSDNPAVAPMKSTPPNPVRYVARFFRQPRLRLAYILAAGRSGWWSMFFIYAPIFAVESGLGDEVGGLLVSLAMSGTMLVPIWGWLGRRYGLRPILITGYLGSAAVTLAVSASFGWPYLGACLLLLAAFMTSILDGGGNLPFLRAVHPYERPEMTTVFSTYRDLGQLAPPGFFSILLKFFPLPSVFVASGIGFILLAWTARYIPKRL